MTIGVVHASPFNSLTPTITSTTGPNHSLVVAVSTFENSGTPSISGITIGGVAMTEADGQSFGGSGVWAGGWIYYLSGVASGQTALVVSGSNLSVGSGSAPGGGVDVIELDCPIVLDTDNHNAGSGTSLSTGSSGPLTVSEEIAIGVLGGFDPSDTAGWTDVGTTNRVSAYKVVSATTALNLTASSPSSADWAGAIATFRRGAGGVVGGFMANIV
jgi:hypothetical protein